MKFWWCLGFFLCFYSVSALAQDADENKESLASSTGLEIVDHHVHLLSPQLVKHWKTLGVPFSHEDEFYSDVTRFLKDEGTSKIILPSMAYLYASEYFEELDGIKENQKTWLESENNFVARLAGDFPDRVIGFGSANPTTLEGLEEFRRCHEKLNMPGFKIHVQASGIDWLNEKHLASVKQLFAYAEEHQIFILIHLSIFDEDAAKEKAEKFVQEVLISHPGQKIIFAHMAGSASYRQQNRDTIKVVTSYLKTDARLKTTQAYFELSAVLLPHASQGVEPPGEEMIKALGEDIKTIGIDRIIFGSDYPGFAPREYAEHLKKALPLKPSEVEQIFGNRVKGLTDGEFRED